MCFVYLNPKVNLSPSKIHCGLSLFIPYLAPVVRESTQKFSLQLGENDAVAEQHGIHYGVRSFLHPLSNFVWRVYVFLVRRVAGDACKFPSPWHKSSRGLLFWELLQCQAIVVGFSILSSLSVCLSASLFLSLPRFFRWASRDAKSF